MKNNKNDDYIIIEEGRKRLPKEPNWREPTEKDFELAGFRDEEAGYVELVDIFRNGKKLTADDIDELAVAFDWTAEEMAVMKVAVGLQPSKDDIKALLTGKSKKEKLAWRHALGMDKNKKFNVIKFEDVIAAMDLDKDTVKKAYNGGLTKARKAFNRRGMYTPEDVISP